MNRVKSTSIIRERKKYFSFVTRDLGNWNCDFWWRICIPSSIFVSYFHSVFQDTAWKRNPFMCSYLPRWIRMCFIWREETICGGHPKIVNFDPKKNVFQRFSEVVSVISFLKKRTDWKKPTSNPVPCNVRFPRHFPWIKCQSWGMLKVKREC